MLVSVLQMVGLAAGPLAIRSSECALSLWQPNRTAQSRADQPTARSEWDASLDALSKWEVCHGRD
jgi:hypothetical protein